jgi:hypothetical protein
MKLNSFLFRWGVFIVFSSIAFWSNEIVWKSGLYSRGFHHLPLLFFFGIPHVAIAARVLVLDGARPLFTSLGLASSVIGIAVFFFVKLWPLFFLSTFLVFWVIVRSGARRSSIIGVVLGLLVGQHNFFKMVIVFLGWAIGSFAP